MGKRKKIPDDVVAGVLETSRRRCCICVALQDDVSEKQGQIAHLDHNPSHNDPDNLAFLCLAHHDQYDSRSSQSKGFTLEEVKHYRAALPATLAAMRSPVPPDMRTLTEKSILTSPSPSKDHEAPDITLYPLNEQGSNRLAKQEVSGRYSLQIRFHVKANMDAEIINVDINYWDSRYWSIRKLLLVDKGDVELDVFNKPTIPIVLTQGQVRQITIIRHFPISSEVADYGHVLISIDINFIASPSIVHREWKYKLDPGGALVPFTA